MRELIGRLLGVEVQRIYRWGRVFDETGHGGYAESTGSYQCFEEGTLLVLCLDETEIECKNE